MALEHLREVLVHRLEEGDRGDRGWFLVTRLHPAPSWIRGIAAYILSRGAGRPIRLTESDYRVIAEMIGISSENPGIQLRRHHLLAMDKPLQLLRRTRGNRWREIELTEKGQELAVTADPATVFEEALQEIRFAQEPWSPPGRVQSYAEFDVRVYATVLQVMAESGGYVDRDEFDLFVSRIRNVDEAQWASQCISEYRALAPRERSELHVEVSSRVPGGQSGKSYANWRDVALHTFSLLGLGTTLVRDGTRLLLTDSWVAEHSESGAEPHEVTEREEGPELRLPEPPERQELLTPPAAPTANDGTDAESLVAKILRAEGWEVSFYTNRRGYGFDLWARRGGSGMLVEVKSSTTTLSTVALTEAEYKAAQQYGRNYVLALVEHLAADQPIVRMLEDPAGRLTAEQRQTTHYLLRREEWVSASALSP